MDEVIDEVDEANGVFSPVTQNETPGPAYVDIQSIAYATVDCQPMLLARQLVILKVVSNTATLCKAGSGDIVAIRFMDRVAFPCHCWCCESSTDMLVLHDALK